MAFFSSGWMHLFTLLLANAEASNKLSDLVAADNDFGLKLYNKFMETEQGNIIFSPLSISLALAMISLGAKGQTLKEIRCSTFTSGIPKEKVHENCKQIMKAIPGNDTKALVSIANKLYTRKGLNIKPSFLISSRNFYFSEPEPVDFSNENEAAEKINNWTSQKTSNKIANIVSPRDFHRLVVLLLVNALYFEAQWASPFNGRLTKSQNFFSGEISRNVVKAMFLHDPKSKAFYGIDNCLHFEVLEKLFESSEFRFGIILPDLAKTSLNEVEKKLSAKSLECLTLNPVIANVTIPKFKIESSFDLSESLPKVGIRSVFLRDKANLSGILDSTSLGLYVSKAIHKTMVEIDEKGAVAAAATAIQVSIRGGSAAVNFTADHPFLFYIKHVKTNSLLFFGRFSHP